MDNVLKDLGNTIGQLSVNLAIINAQKNDLEKENQELKDKINQYESKDKESEKWWILQQTEWLMVLMMRVIKL